MSLATICKICNYDFKSLRGLAHHLRHHNITSKDYYDRYFKKKDEGVCSCGKNTTYKNINRGYGIFCHKCSFLNALKIKNASLKKIKEEKLNKIIQCKFCKRLFKPWIIGQTCCSVSCVRKFAGITQCSKEYKDYKFNYGYLTEKEYFDKFLKKENNGKCKICGEETKFLSIQRGYRKTCSNKCIAIAGGKASYIKNPDKWKLMVNAFMVKAKGKTYEEMYGVKKALRKRKILSEAHKGTHPSVKTKELQSKIMKNKILLGEFIPRSTNRFNHKKLEITLGSKTYFFRSSWELETAKFLLSLDINEIGYEKLKLKYFDTIKNKYRIYIVDFYIEELKLIIEIKPKSLLTEINSIDKDKSLLEYCSKNGHTRLFITEEDIKNNFSIIKSYVENYKNKKH